MSDAGDHHLGEDLAAMADGGRDLSPEKKLELERHIESCAICKAAISQARLVLKTVDVVRRAPEPSSSFDASLFSRLDAVDREVRGSIWEKIRELFTLPKIGVAVAAAAALILGIVFFEQDRRSPEDLLTPELAQNLEGFMIADELELYQDLELAENFDVLEDLEAIEAMDGEQG
jgi:hypothetical protein